MAVLYFSLRKNLIALFTILLIGLAVIYMVDQNLESNERGRRTALLEKVNRRTAIELSKSLDKFVYFVSNIRPYLIYSEQFPTQTELKHFVDKQIDDLQYQDSLVISFVDSNHKFKYSFTRTEIDPVGLIGKSVADLTDSTSMVRISAVLLDDDFHLFSAANLVEGWVGIPLHFNVLRNGKSVGYIAAIADFKSIIDPIYLLESADEFVFRFSINDTPLDRYAVHNGSKVHHNKTDQFSFNNYDVDKASFIYSDFIIHDLNFKVETAYIAEFKSNKDINIVLYGWFILIGIFVVYALYGSYRFKKLSDNLRIQKRELDEKNEELNELNHTKDKFFSIIGHDLKSPLSSITSALELWKSESITASQTEKIRKHLEISTRSTLGLLENLLQWSLINTDHLKWNPEPVKLEEMIDEVFSQLRSVALLKETSLTRKVVDNCNLIGDYNMISTIIRNLVANAVKFGEANSEVLVEACVENEKIVIAVSDQGIGLSRQEVDSLFDTNKKGSGSNRSTGLGLVLVKEFMDLHKAEIDVKSTVGEGTTFILKFPQLL